MKKIILAVLPILAVVPFLFAGCSGSLLKQESQQQHEEPVTDQSEISVTAEDIQRYREMVGSDFDTKKAIIILFNTQQECADFIQQHGGDENIMDLGIGTVPEMSEDNEGKFYNVTGNTVLEPFFDTLSDGKYVQEPFEYAGMWCYLKRLKVYNILDDEQSAEDFIKEINKQQRGND